MALPLDDAVRIGITSRPSATCTCSRRLSPPAARRSGAVRAGVRHAILDMPGGGKESRAQLERFVREIRPRLRLKARTPSVA